MQIDGKTLLAGLKSGNELAYQQLFNSYYELLISYAGKYLNSKESCRDVVQKVFIRLYEKRETLQIETPRAYLLKAIYHGCLEELRSQKLFVETQETDRTEDLDL